MPGQEQQVLHQLAHGHGFLRDRADALVQYLGVLFPPAPQHIRIPLDHGDRGPQLVGRVGNKLLLAVVALFNPVQHGVDYHRQVLQLIFHARDVDPVGQVRRRQGFRNLRHFTDRGKHLPVQHLPPPQEGHHPEDIRQDDSGNHGRPQEQALPHVQRQPHNMPFRPVVQHEYRTPRRAAGGQHGKEFLYTIPDIFRFGPFHHHGVRPGVLQDQLAVPTVLQVRCFSGNPMCQRGNARHVAGCQCQRHHHRCQQEGTCQPPAVMPGNPQRQGKPDPGADPPQSGMHGFRRLVISTGFPHALYLFLFTHS